MPVGRAATGDAVGLVLAASLAGWTLVSALATEADLADAAPLLGTIGAAAAAFAVGRVVGSIARWPVPVAVAAGAVLAAAASWSSGPGRADHGGVLGYSNASAELFVQGFAAALVAVAVLGRRAWSVPMLAAAAILALAVLRGDSVAAQALLLLPAAAFVVAATRRRPQWVVGGLAALLAVAIGGTIVLGVTGGGGGPRPFIDATLSSTRVDLWHDALVLMAEHPVVGVGPGRFREESPTALADRDAGWAHNGFLQLGAETGVPGLALLVGVFAWCFARLAAASDGPAVIAAAGLAALGIHACVDYVLHFPILPIVTAALVGSAATTRKPPPVDPTGTSP